MCRVGILVLVILTIITKMVAQDIDAEMYAPTKESDVREFPSSEEEESCFIETQKLVKLRDDALPSRVLLSSPKESTSGILTHQNQTTSEYDAHNLYIRQIHSMINAYRSDMLGGRLVIETNALIDTKYRTWKRNADLINSLLALPKGMNEAGR